MDREAIAWAAGLYEGEGHIRSTTPHSKSLQLLINMTDVEPLEQFRDTFAAGKVRGPTPRGEYKPIWHYGLYNFEQIQAIVAMMWPWLSPRRREQAMRVLMDLRARRESLEARRRDSIVWGMFGKPKAELTSREATLARKDRRRRAEVRVLVAPPRAG